MAGHIDGNTDGNKERTERGSQDAGQFCTHADDGVRCAVGPDAVPCYAQHGVAKGEGPRKPWFIEGFTAKGSKNPAQHVGNWNFKLTEQEPDECSRNKNKKCKHKASPFLWHPAPQAADSFPSLIVPESQGMGK